ncbi:hypothetical protein ZIOFF_002114 [Zingiber officinale]|uniref:Aminoacyl-tRNA synthetase class II (D/K/N) domain-containing protein n=1 Tax=Zingiber officinale TaxID=94328 RepID=A0A8J5I4K7_ZINOF|nr:hypothetical protein ZIOFF_002114 [Zingiber officinale]
MEAASLSADPALEPSRACTFIKWIVTAPADELVGGWGQDGARAGKVFFCISRAERRFLPREPPGDRRRGCVPTVAARASSTSVPSWSRASSKIRLRVPSRASISGWRRVSRYSCSFFALNLFRISAIARIRDELAYATHTFFSKNGFRYIHTPIVTTKRVAKEYPLPSESAVEVAELIVKEKGEVVSLLKEPKASKDEIVASIAELNKSTENVSKLEERFNLKPGLPQKDGKIDYARYPGGFRLRHMLSPLPEIAFANLEFDNKVEWGVDLAFEHERYLTEVIFKKPVIVYNYPKGIKPFYMRLNNDQKTLVAMDVLVPEVGELIKGSQREECLYILVKRFPSAEVIVNYTLLYESLKCLDHLATLKKGSCAVIFFLTEKLWSEHLVILVIFPLNLLQISAIAQIRDELAYATHTVFRKNGFRYIHTPITSTSDCEGAGEMFQVTTLFSDAEKLEKELQKNPLPSDSDVEVAELIVKEKRDCLATGRIKS